MNRHAQRSAEREQQMSNTKRHDTAQNTAPTSATADPKKARPKQKATRKKAAHKGRTGAHKGMKTARQERTKTSRPQSSANREGSKSAKILALIGRPQGATLPEIMQAIGWQAHSVRGFLSTAVKKQGLQIESTRNEAGQRHYRLKG
jgi:hypothetical protein